MVISIKAKRVSYGIIEIKDHGAQSPRYAIYVNGQIKEYSDDLTTLLRIFETKYY